MTVSISVLSATMLSDISLSMAFFHCCAECHHSDFWYTECNNAEFLNAERHFDEHRHAKFRNTDCHYPECHYAACYYPERHYTEFRGDFFKMFYPSEIVPKK